MQTRLISFFVSLFGLSLLTLQPLTVYAQIATSTSVGATTSTFNPEFILSNDDLFEFQGMNLERIQQFLVSKPGVLANYRTNDIDGVEKSAATILWRVATSYHINPKYLLALMQKEQSLVEDPNPAQKQFDWATGYAICDACSKNDPRLQEFKGFASQLEWAAKQHREKYLIQILGRGTTVAGYAPGKTIKIDGQTLTPKNQATAMLYSYTPHLHGNLNLWNIWQRWFSLLFPEGTVVRGAPSNKTYLIRFGEKRPFKSKAVAASMVDPNKVINVSDNQIASYPTGPTISFPNYSIVETPDKKRYLISGDNKRWIAGLKVFRQFGFNEDEIIEASADDLLAYADAPDITASTTHPTGLLAKDAEKSYWYLENDVRRLILNKTFLNLYFKNRTARLLTQKQLSAFTIGDPYRLRDGELVRSPTQPAVFVIENGFRRLIPSAEVFEELGWKWNNVVSLPDSVLKDYAIGSPITTSLSSL